VRLAYKYTFGLEGQGWTDSEEWPGNQRLLELEDLTGDHRVTRWDLFGDEAAKSDEWSQKARWEDIKAEERKAKSQGGVLDDVPVGLPALARAAKLTKRAARVGFDWPSTDEVFAKLDEEVAELRVEIAAGDLDKAREEMGDLLFVVANLARKLGVEPEDALRGANAKFVRRFGFIETELARDGRTPDQSDLAEMDGLWDAAKAAERGE
jgi:MazG family protein